MTDISPKTGAPRPPIVAIVGHIDHGKSTLLDYIRKTNVVEGEAGGITQHLSAYEATHKNASGEHRITFLDTPGHEAFTAMRARGLEAADVAILIVSSEDGAKPQTTEALKLILEVGIPYIVAFTKIDKPGANLEKAKLSMLEQQVFLEGMGGDVAWVGVSSKTGEGIPELLDLILLQAELEGVSADPKKPGEGLIIEAHVDSKRGNTATLIVQDGTIASGKFVVAGSAMAPVRIMENFLGKPVKEAHAGSPVRIVGFSELPAVGSRWSVVDNKKEAEQLSSAARLDGKTRPSGPERRREGGDAEMPLETEVAAFLPLIIKTDFAGTGDAVVHELEKMPHDPRFGVRILARSTGAITESDVKLAGGGKTPGIIVGFNVKVEREARDVAERLGVEIQTFDIIYKLTEWLTETVEKRRPRAETEVITGAAKVLKFFSNQKGRIVLGGRVEDGVLKQNMEVRIMRRDIELGRGTIVGLQQNKKDVREVEKSQEFGMLLKSGVEPAAGDRLEAFVVEYK
jgi:translation initiation factor IF-2